MAENMELDETIVINEETTQGSAEIITIDDDDEPVVVNTAEIANIKGLADTLFRQKEPKEAVDLYTAAINLAPENPITAMCYANRGTCNILLSRYEEAIPDFEKAIKLEPTYTKSLARLLRCKTALGDDSACKKIIDEFDQLFGISTNTLFCDEVIYFKKIERFKSEAFKAYEKEEYRTALYHVDQMRRSGVVSVFCKTFKAECLAFLGRYKEAQEMANSVLLFDNRNVEAIFARAICLYHGGELANAQAELKRVLSYDPDHKKARPLFQNAKNIKNKREEGNKAFHAEQLEQAYALYTEALAIDPSNSKVNCLLYNNRAAAALKLLRFNDCIADCSSSLELDSTYVKALQRRARCWQELGKFQEALKDLKEACRLEDLPKNIQLVQDCEMAMKKALRKDLYKVLGVTPNASDYEIKKSYRNKAKLHHPDRHINDTEEERLENERKFKEVEEANAILSDPVFRRSYDQGDEISTIRGGGNQGNTTGPGPGFYRPFNPSHTYSFHFP